MYALICKLADKWRTDRAKPDLGSALQLLHSSRAGSGKPHSGAILPFLFKINVLVMQEVGKGFTYVSLKILE